MISMLITAFIIGAIGTVHCLGMCGPLALALPVHHLQKIQQAIAVLLYNLGRVITYSILGGIFGWLGRVLMVVAPVKRGTKIGFPFPSTIGSSPPPV